MAEKPPLPCVSFLHVPLDARQHLVVAQLHPRLGDEEARRHFARKTLDDNVGIEPLGKVDDEIDIFL